ncbi:MAG TPA: galactokinase [Clostridiales bacterium]|nr:galactokinase [Clostridiales bacterium]
MLSSQLKEYIRSGKLDSDLSHIYVCGADGLEPYRTRLIHAVEAFEEQFGANREVAVFSAPGRTEVGGNHTDHQGGHVLAASVNLDVVAIVSKNENATVNVKSEGYLMDSVNIAELEPKEEEQNHSAALIRGILAKFTQLGYTMEGFDAYTTSSVLSGSGLSSSAAFEVLIGTIVNHLFCGAKESAVRVAQIGKYAENVFFGKPCGLMDQAASSVGGFITIDFGDQEHPEVEKIDFDFASCGYALCIIDTRGNHADLTPDYAAIPAEMKEVAAFFGKELLSQVSETEFYAQIGALRQKMGDRCVLRAMHYFGDNARVGKEVEALKANDFSTFKNLVVESGHSSYMYLQNVFSPSHVQEQGVSLTLALCERLLKPVGGAYRVHGGGFAGTVQTFVPVNYLPEFVEKMEAVLGAGSCHTLSIRPVGGIKII